MTPKENPMPLDHDYLDALEAALEVPTLGADGTRPPFVVDSDDKADWCLRKIAQLRATQAERAAYVARETGRLTDWQAKEDRQAEQSLEFFTHLLHGYLRGLRDLGTLGQRKSYPLPHGVLKLRAAEVKWARDDTALLPWAKAAGLVRVTESPDWAGIKTRIQPARASAGAEAIDVKTGEVVPGVTVEWPAREVFSVATEGDEPLPQ
jgi:Bacteriophage Mu Gam like protein